MKKFERHDDQVEQDDVIDLGVASDITRGPIVPIVFEPFAFLPFAGLAKD
jgi:hypothetical protein